MPWIDQTPRARRPAGEVWVWFTAMGLTVGLAMILGLLAVVLVNGLRAFWPGRVVEITLREGPATATGGPQRLAGEIVREQVKPVHTLDAPGSGQRPREWQLFLGNKDAYGLAFRFVDVDQIATREQPRAVIRIERLEYGPALGFPVALRLKDRPPIPADAPEFRAELRRVVAEAAQRRAELRRVEKRDIGRINQRLARLRLRERALEREAAAGRDVAAERGRISAEQAALQADYERLATRARALRAAQQEHAFVYRLTSGEERQLPVGQIVDFYFPNELTGGQRLARFGRNLVAFLTEEPREANTEGGIFPAIFGTFVMTVLMSVAVTPLGVLAAIYLREYARQGALVRAVRIAVNNLAGVPSIVFGVFGLGFFVYVLGGTVDALLFRDALPTPTFGTGGLLWASLTLALMTVPVVVVATEEALAAVPRGAREGSLACGASKWQTLQRVVLPAAAPGILTGVILAMARGAGEVAPLMLVGVVKLAPELPLNLEPPFLHLDQKFMHLGFHIYDLGFQSPDSEAARPMVFATTLFLIALVVVLNLGAIWIREKLRRKYALGAF
ncbi:MAG: phosphate ABC transporter permease PstA [Verrucomicrobiae bacterium]|nr:phosphate ABC transporter permease PstA [Verrucomicrobiae bacterium]